MGKKLKKRVLRNGIPVLMDRVEGIQSVSLGIFVKTGSKNELEGEEGISHFLEHMLFKGTKTKTSREISEIIDNEGGIINAYTGKETTVYYIQMLSNKLKSGIEILSDMFLNSTFSKENIEKEKLVIMEEINMYNDIPEEIIHDQNLYMSIDGVQRNMVLGNLKSVGKIDKQKLLKYFKERYTPKNIIISIAGNFSEESVFNLLNENFGEIKDSNSLRFYNGKMSVNSNENIIKKDTNQVHICFNTLGSSIKDSKKYEVSIISNVLAGNMSSRLFQKIREDKGLVYSIYGYPSSYEEGGILTIYAATTKKNYKKVLDMIEKEIKNIKENGITEEELRRTKNQFLSGITFGLETNKGRMNRMANSYLINGEVKDLSLLIEEIEKITIKDIKLVANEIFDEKYYSKTILGKV